jgi:small GTP-binding protein
MNCSRSGRVVAIGNTCVGKTSLIGNLTGDPFNAKERTTIGANWRLFNHTVNGELVQMQIWDTAGQERYRALGPLYFRDAVAAVVIYDITSRDSWNGIEPWIDSLISVAGSHVAVFVVGNKVDLANSRSVSQEEASAWAANHGYDYFETSARTGQGVRPLFETVATRITTLKPRTLERAHQTGNKCC